MSRPLVELLEDVLDNIEDANDGLTDNLDWLDLSDRSLVEGHIVTAISRIEEALARLDDAGMAESLDELESLAEVTDRCVELAQEALEAHETTGASPDVVGGKLKTIRQLIMQGPHGLETLNEQ